MAEFVLVHGTCHGAWCWQEVIPLLQTRGHGATAIDLPGHGQDRTPPAEVTLESCGQRIVSALQGPSILVGHSWGGLPITVATELAPEMVVHRVYLCAHVPQDGDTMASLRVATGNTAISSAVTHAPDGHSYQIDPLAARDMFYHDCPEDRATFAMTRLGPQPSRPQSEPVRVTSRSARRPASYVTCLDDRVIPANFQTGLSRRFPPVNRHKMACGHSPFFADPEGLVDILSEIAEG